MKKISEIDDMTKNLCIKAILIALTALFTMVIHIPTPATGGYINAGDAIILISAVFFGSNFGFAAGGFGSALADILLGYAYWAPFTFIIKGLMGLFAGKLSDYKTSGNLFSARNVFTTIFVEIFMVSGYFFSEAIFRGGFLSATQSVPGNISQGVGGIIIFFSLGTLLHKSNFLNRLK
ncbi:MAG: ECF transporter S component [Lachnospiraceae bacterium]|nr:ECF transporter S component [Lachnospiraceae bacterium]